MVLSTGVEPRLKTVLARWIASDPGRLVLSTTKIAAQSLRLQLGEFLEGAITIQAVETLEFREQLIKAIQTTESKFLVITDDRSYPSSRLLKSLANTFANPQVGGVTTARHVVPVMDGSLSTWESFHALNQVRRRILHATLAYFHDGQVLNLGGFSAYRTAILKTDEFYAEVRQETWLGKYKIVTGDDNTTTRFIIHRGWKSSFLNSNEDRIFAGGLNESRYLKQVSRWSRDTARSYITDVRFAVKSGRRRAYLHAGLNIIANYTSDALVLFEILFLFLTGIVALWNRTAWTHFCNLSMEHLLTASAFTIMEHLPFFTTPSRLLYVPGTILYMYLHAFIVMHALFTLHKVRCV
ncbi:hypothetical protein BDV96DRAFT_504470 [Lophiotrema nucula]|uniref:Glycosyltransferase 2-like domain-containing protein n=1 Tax=Lophiotrema nucula TaxID=690887 RepID=A0A6A5YNC7_9PLEO|nr:hypothetical protein BDV96DRAFT_504470 [Lophiotrema nucula]